jgi:hypothetical protein
MPTYLICYEHANLSVSVLLGGIQVGGDMKMRIIKVEGQVEIPQITIIITEGQSMMICQMIITMNPPRKK